jgi:hypothetical protein
MNISKAGAVVSPVSAGARVSMAHCVSAMIAATKKNCFTRPVRDHQ